jgi:hypothetical protein
MSLLRRHRRRRLEAIEDAVRRQGEQLAFNTAALMSQGASAGPAVPAELTLAAGEAGERAVLLEAGGEEIIVVLGDGRGDPRALWDAVCHEIAPGVPPQRGRAS